MAGPRPTPNYSPEEIDKALVCVLALGGNCNRAAKTLQEAGSMEHPPSARVLQLWKAQRPERYEQLQEQYAPMIAQKVAAESEALAISIAQAERAVVERLISSVDDVEPRDLSRALRDLSTSKALQFDKLSNPLRGRPSAIIADQRDGADILRSLALRIPGLIIDEPIDSTAIEIQTQRDRPDPDAEWHPPDPDD